MKPKIVAALRDLPDAGHPSFLHDAVAAVRRKVSESAGRSDRTGPLLLHDLRELFVLASDCEMAWTILGQGAKASRDTALVDLYSECCEDGNGQMRGIKRKMKRAAPQVLAVG